MQQECRVFDRVVVPGSKVPMKVWTVDLDTDALSIEMPPRLENVTWNARRRFKARQALEVQKNSKLHHQTTMHSLYSSASDVAQMRKMFTDRFYFIFGMAYHNYIAGEWITSYNMLKETHLML